MKKPPTETVVVGRRRFQVPQEAAKAVLVLLKGAVRDDAEVILADESEAIRKIDKKYSRPGACLQGARLKEGLSQVALAKKLGVPQTNVSAMELGKRPIGKKMAKRIAKVLNIDYRTFL
jgi:ribosome-binding protein aMBF1 (putative translation factor)